MASAVRTEVDRAAAPTAMSESTGAFERLGDLLFAVVTLAAAAGVDAETALRGACERFVARQDSADEPLAPERRQ